MEKYYIAKPDSWFKTGTVVKLIEYMYNVRSQRFGNFEGTYVVRDEPYDTYWKNKGFKSGDEVLMTEVCSYDEFEEYTKLPDESTINKMAFDYVENMMKEEPDDSVLNQEDFRLIGHSWKQGFIMGFKYLEKLYQQENKEKTY